MISTVAALEEGGTERCETEISQRVAVCVWQSNLLSFTFFFSLLRTTGSAVGGGAVNKASEPPSATPFLITIDFLSACEAERAARTFKNLRHLQ